MTNAFNVVDVNGEQAWHELVEDKVDKGLVNFNVANREILDSI